MARPKNIVAEIEEAPKVIEETVPATSEVTVEDDETAVRNLKQRLASGVFGEDVATFLFLKTPPSEIKQRQGRGNSSLSYVSQGYVTERLNIAFGFNWDFQVTDWRLEEDGRQIVVVAELSVPDPTLPGRMIRKVQFGGADVNRYSTGTNAGKAISLADDLKSAASDALKKCASLFGIGLDLYGREGDPMEEDDYAAPSSAGVKPAFRTSPTTTAKANPNAEKTRSYLLGLAPDSRKTPAEIGTIVSEFSGGKRLEFMTDAELEMLRNNVTERLKTLMPA